MAWNQSRREVEERWKIVPAVGCRWWPQAGPRLALLLGRIALEDLHVAARRAVGVFAVGRMAGAPEVLEAGGVVGEVGQELGDRIVGGRRLRPARFVAVGRWHVVRLLDTSESVK
jgi:hypothetical protein